MKNLPKTKIVATIGPSTWDDDVLTQMINHGLSIARINTSFADHKELDRVMNQIRSLSPRTALMLDTQGPKIRLTGFEKEKNLKIGDELVIVSEGKKGKKRGSIKIEYPTLEKDITRGKHIYCDDGLLDFEVVDIQGNDVIFEVKAGGILKPRKTVNIPGTHLNLPCINEKDKEDIKHAVKTGYDMVAASFIRNKNDVKTVRKAMGNTDAMLIAKIEDYEGMEKFDEILERVDGIMIGRGDLAVEVSLEKLPILQKTFIYKCRQKGKPVIVATQMLDSMRINPVPTKAEVSDVANAIMDGTDAIMLSAETSVGKHPIKAVEMMSRVANEVEGVLTPQTINDVTGEGNEIIDVMGKHLLGITKDLNIAGVIIVSTSTATIGSISRHRLNIPIWAFNSNPKMIRQLQMYKGVTGFYVKDFKTTRDSLITQVIDVVYGNGYLEMTDKVAIITDSSLEDDGLGTVLEIINVSEAIK